MHTAETIFTNESRDDSGPGSKMEAVQVVMDKKTLRSLFVDIFIKIKSASQVVIKVSTILICLHFI